MTLPVDSTIVGDLSMRLPLVCVFLILAVTSALAQVDRSKKPEPGPTPQVKLPKLEHAQLTNGLHVVMVEQRQMPVIQLQLVIQTGSVADPKGKPGVAYVTAQMISEGTKTRLSLQIADDFDFIGAQYGASVNEDGSFVTLLTLAEHFTMALAFFSDVLLNPVFPQSEYARVQKRIVTSLLQNKDQPEFVAGNVFSKMLYGEGHPYGEPVGGTETSVKSITTDDLRTFYDAYYRPNNATLIAVGDIHPKEVVAELEKVFGAWEKRDVPATTIPPSPAAAGPVIYIVDKPKAAQSQFRIGEIGLNRASDDYYRTLVLNQLLGGSFNSRINWKLREEKGYTYGARSAFSYRKEAGPFVVSAGVKTSVTDSSVILTLDELKRIRTELVPEKELSVAKSAIIRGLPRGFETVSDIARQITALVLYNLPDDYYSHIVENVEKVTAEDVQKAAQRYIHPDTDAVVIVGDVSAVKAPLERLGYGKIVVVDDQGKPVK